MNAAFLSARWRAIPARARAGLLCAFVGILASATVAGIVLQRPRAQLFAAALAPEQLAEVQERLAQWNVPFTPTSDNVVVDRTRRNDVLLRLSLAGVPHAHVAGSGEALASISALTPQAVIDAQTRAGLAGDIELGLRGVAGVEDARVIVAPAQRADFADESAHAASASVRLRMRDGAQLSHDAVEGIRQFVAASVAGLDSAHVTIVDDRGVALGGGHDTGDTAQALQTSLQSALDQAFSAGATIVRVRAERTVAAHEEHDVRTEPLSVLALEGTDETFRSNGKTYAKHARTEQHGTQTRDATTSTPAGRVSRLSVAVFVDATRGLDLAKIRALAAATVGLDERRGDVLTVESMNFADARPARKDGWWLAYGAIVPLLPTLAVAMAALVALRWALPPIGAALRSLVDRVAIAQTREAVAGFAPRDVAGALRNEPPHAAAAVISALPAATAAAVLDMYPPHERAAIVRRMQRPRSPLVPDAREIIDRA